MTNAILKDAYANLERRPGIKIIDNNSQANAKYYTVKKGDTLSKIAVENDTTVSLLCKLNKIKKTDKLKVGRKVRVK
ncbi:MAG: LysM peptidoglycan-binding domain-containing protein [Bacteroidales bacterium]|nr:LysM peptidoglycan-binding domain-containing protein [Bacteroidales bacterium]